jgi:hypothetical protein
MPLYLNGVRLDTVGEGDLANRFARPARKSIRPYFPTFACLWSHETTPLESPARSWT